MDLGDFCRPTRVPESRKLLFFKKLKNVSCEYDRLNGWNSTFQAAWYFSTFYFLFLYYIPTPLYRAPKCWRVSIRSDAWSMVERLRQANRWPPPLPCIVCLCYCFCSPCLQIEKFLIIFQVSGIRYQTTCMTSACSKHRVEFTAPWTYTWRFVASFGALVRRATDRILTATIKARTPFGFPIAPDVTPSTNDSYEWILCCKSS